MPLTRICATTALITAMATSVMATSVMADVTASDVWNGYRAVSQSIGLDIDAIQIQNGNTTTLRDLKISGVFPFDMGSISIFTDGFDLVENTDGTVDIKLPDTLPIAVAMSLPDNRFVTANLEMQSTGYTTQASGDPDNYTITYAIEKVQLRLVDITLPDTMAADIEFTSTTANIVGTTTYKTGDMVRVSQQFTSGTSALDGRFTGQDPEAVETTTTFSMQLLGSQTDSNMVLPLTGIDLLNLSDHLRDGMSFHTTSTGASIATRNHVTSRGETVSDEKTFAESSDTTMSASQNGLKLDSVFTNYVIDYILKELPFPIRLTLAKAGGSVEMPLLKSDAEQDVSYAAALEGVTMGEDLWAMFDPTGVLPRDPANLNLDLSGTGHLFMDLLDFKSIIPAVKEDDKIAEPASITINALDFAAIGAKLAGSGVFTFDNDDYVTFDGIPAPTGTATVHFAGVNTLIDQLISIELLDSDAALGLRMGLGLFTVIGAEKDTLISEIEITPQGQIRANGKRLK